MPVLTVFPSADLAGPWELNQPLPVDGTGGYREPRIVYSDTAGYLGEDSAAAAFQPGVLTMPTVIADDIAVIITAVADGTTTAALTGADAPEVNGTNEVQRVTSYMTAGTFTLTHNGNTTSALNWNDTAGTIQAALEALASIGAGNVTCTGGPINTAPVTITFTGALAQTNVGFPITTSQAYVAPVNEVQRIVSTRTGGTFTLTYAGSTTTAINWNATAATIQTALIALPNLDTGHVVCTGGNVNTAPVIITFGGSLAATDVAQITVTDSGTGGTGITLSTDTAGVAQTGQVVAAITTGVNRRPFTLETTINVPRDAADQPQLHIWWLECVPADSGRLIDITVADHDTLHTWAASLLVGRDCDNTNPLETTGTDVTGTGPGSTWGTVTPATAGSLVLAIAAKTTPGAYYDPGSSISPPAGYPGAVVATSDAMTLATFISDGLSGAAESPSPVSWGNSERFCLGLISLRPTTAATAGGGGLWPVLDDTTYDDWVDIGAAAGSMYEVVEFDMTALPAGAVVTGVAVDVAHMCPVSNRLRFVAVGINADDTINRGTEQQLGYIPLPVSQVQTSASAFWTELEGERVDQFDRFGVALFSTDRHPSLTTHKIYWARGRIEYEAGGPVVSSVVGPTAPGSPITWVYNSASGLSQTHWQVMVIAGAGEDPDLATVAANPLDAAAGEIVFDSGRVAGDLTRSLASTGGPLGRGAHTVAVRAWATLSSGISVASDWGVDDFDITGAPGGTPAQPTQPTFNTADGSVSVSVVVPAAVSRAWLYRSPDNGATWEMVEGSPFDVTPSTTQVVSDFGAPFQSTTLRYEVSFDTRAMTETGAPAVHAGGAVSTPAAGWYFIVPDAPELSTEISVKEVKITVPVRTATAEQPGNSVTASSLPLAKRVSLQLWIKNADVRAAVDAVLSSGLLIRLVDLWGVSTSCRVVSGVDNQPVRWQRLESESTGLRNASVYSVDLVEELVP